MNLMNLTAHWLQAWRGKLPVVSIFGGRRIRLCTTAEVPYEEKRLDCRCYGSDADLPRILIRDKPDAIVTIGDRASYPRIASSPREIRRRWLHCDRMPGPEQLGNLVYRHYVDDVLDHGRERAEPLVSVVTATCKTGEKIRRPFCSLQEQTYGNWEWVIVDDSNDNGKTFRMLCDLARQDHRIRVFKPWEPSGVIGRVKNWACSLADGEILVELDHDDALTDYALACVVKGFAQFPEAGFLYPDCAEVDENQTSHTYRDGWAFGYGSYTDVPYRGRVYKSGSGGNINAKTIRHIVSSPNHIRAWRRAFYQAIGGHNKELPVADDYELIVRTFLKTRMIRVPRLCYLQYRGDTAQQRRNGDIHRHVRSIQRHYDRLIHERFLALGCDDFAWDEKTQCSNHLLPNPAVESHATLIAAMEDE